MDKIQILLNTLTWFFLTLAGIVAWRLFYRQRLGGWLYSALFFLILAVNKVFDLDNKIVGRWLLSGGIAFVNYMNKTLPWLKLYKQPGFVVDFSFMIAGLFMVIALSRILKKEKLSYALFVAGIVSFIVVVALGFNLASIEHKAVAIVILQFIKDSSETTGSIFIFLSFLTYFLKTGRVKI